MIPTASNGPRSEWLGKMRRRTVPLVDYELGSAALNDTAGGLASHQWVCEVVDGEVRVYREDTPDSFTVVFTNADITWVALAFDQNMAPVIAYQTPAGSYIRVNDSSTIPFSGSYPCACLDERRPEQISISDVNVSYVRDGTLYCRTQRENYATERALATGWGVLTGFAMTTGLRLQWRGQPI